MYHHPFVIYAMMMRKYFLIMVTEISQFQNGKEGSYALDFKHMEWDPKNYLIDGLFCFCCRLIKQEERLYLLYNISTYPHDLIYIIFSIFSYCQKIYKDGYEGK